MQWVSGKRSTGYVSFLKGDHGVFSSLDSATVNNLQAKVDALEKSNTKLTEEVSALGLLPCKVCLLCLREPVVSV